jgi:iron complex outermembrane recepter protein
MTSGMEIVGVWDLKQWWRLRGWYAFMGLNARNKAASIDASTVRQLEGDSPAHTALLRTLFDLPKRFELDLAWRFVAAIPNQRVSAYSTADVRLGRRITDYFDLAVVGQNLLQPSHVEYGGNPGALVGIKRSAYLKLTWTR